MWEQEVPAVLIAGSPSWWRQFPNGTVLETTSLYMPLSSWTTADLIKLKMYIIKTLFSALLIAPKLAGNSFICYYSRLFQIFLNSTWMVLVWHNWHCILWDSRRYLFSWEPSLSEMYILSIETNLILLEYQVYINDEWKI